MQTITISISLVSVLNNVSLRTDSRETEHNSFCNATYFLLLCFRLSSSLFCVFFLQAFKLITFPRVAGLQLVSFAILPEGNPGFCVFVIPGACVCVCVCSPYKRLSELAINHTLLIRLPLTDWTYFARRAIRIIAFLCSSLFFEIYLVFHTS